MAMAIFLPNLCATQPPIATPWYLASVTASRPGRRESTHHSLGDERNRGHDWWQRGRKCIYTFGFVVLSKDFAETCDVPSVVSISSQASSRWYQDGARLTLHALNAAKIPHIVAKVEGAAGSVAACSSEKVQAAHRQGVVLLHTSWWRMWFSRRGGTAPESRTPECRRSPWCWSAQKVDWTRRGSQLESLKNVKVEIESLYAYREDGRLLSFYRPAGITSARGGVVGQSAFRYMVRDFIVQESPGRPLSCRL